MIWFARCFVLFCLIARVAAADEPLTVIDTQKDPQPLSTPAAALAAIKAPPGFRVTMFAAEPDVRQPIAMTTDARGRLWIAENYTYAESPISLDERHRDRITILDDTDGDGVCDKSLVFWDQAKQLTSVEVGFGGAWAMCPPQLLFLPDRDGDDRFDGEPVVVLDGFDVGAANRHNFANGLKWGPDGWLYGRNGISNVGQVGVPGTPPEKRVEVGPGVWRFHPVTKRVEMVATGTTNPWGHDWDDYGELFFINTVIGHLWHAVPGAHFKRMFGADSSPHVYELLDQNADHVHWDTAEAWNDAKKGVSPTTDQAGGGHAHCGMMIYLGDNWPERYRGQLFTLNMHGRRVNCDRLERHGASYVGKHEPDFLFSGDPWFRGTELIYGPDGGVYIADWSDIGECHENDGVHRSSGRIFKVKFEKPATGGASNAKPQSAPQLDRLTDVQLVALQIHPNDWFVRQSRRLLQERAAAGKNLRDAHAALRQQYAKQSDPRRRLRALWALHVTGGLPPEELLEKLADSNENVRAWVVRLLTDSLELAPNGQEFQVLPPQISTQLVKEAASDKSGLVLVYLASALQRMSTAERWPLAEALAKRRDFADDRVLPLMIWYGVESAVEQHPQEAVNLAYAAQIPLVRRFLARRVTSLLDTQPEPVNRLVEKLAGLKSADEQRQLVTGMNEALRGWRKATPPAAWKGVYAGLQKSGDAEVQRLAREMAVVFGDGRALDELKQVATSAKYDLPSRRAAIRSLVDARANGLIPLLQGLLTDHDIAPEAVRGMAAFNDPGTPKLLLDNYRRLYPPGREAAVATLTARPESARSLLLAIEAGVVDRGHVAVFQIRQMQGYDDLALGELLKKLWPELRPIAADKKARIVEFKNKLSADALRTADAAAGRAHWEKSCAKCHVLFGQGGKIGPDLTGAQRSNLDYLLENILDPSATLAANFRMTTIALKDGRVINGVVLNRTAQTWEVQTPTEKSLIPKGDIETSRETELSLMPDGQLDLLQPNEVRDLIAYLMSGQQIPLRSE